MGDLVKIGVKTALVALVVAAAVVILTSIQLPEVDLTILREVIGHGKAIVNYYGANTILSNLLVIGFSLLFLKYVTLPILAITSLAIRWIFKVNE